ncbi:MAG: lipopolysaccharide transport periplasmic protein LptA [Gammaproteobacteria bacterium]
MTGATALPGDNDQEISLSADNQLLDRQRGIATYRGNVHVTRGGMEIRGDELILHFNDDELAGATVLGDPVRFKHVHGDDRPATEAEAHELNYDATIGEVRLRGAVRVTQSGNEFLSEDLRYDVNTERIVAAGESDSRIRVTIQPRKPADDEDDAEPRP